MTTLDVTGLALRDAVGELALLSTLAGASLHFERGAGRVTIEPEGTK